MNNFKTIRNLTTGTLVIHDIAPDPDGIGALTLIMNPGETVDLSLRYSPTATAACPGLDTALSAGQIEVINTQETLDSLTAAVAAQQLVLNDHEARIAALEALT